MLKGIGNAVDDLARPDDQFPIRRCPDGPRAGVVTAERKGVIKRSIRVITDEWTSRAIRRCVDVPKQDVFAVGKRTPRPGGTCVAKNGALKLVSSRIELPAGRFGLRMA